MTLISTTLRAFSYTQKRSRGPSEFTSACLTAPVIFYDSDVRLAETITSVTAKITSAYPRDTMDWVRIFFTKVCDTVFMAPMLSLFTTYPRSEKLPWNENATEEAKYQAQHIHNTVDRIVRFGNHTGEKAKA